ncbi:MAG: 1-deoxy-D-xylulose-5-phosphate synthase N-terminal domain-containing protein [Ilumatobacteraceae bacterium]
MPTSDQLDVLRVIEQRVLWLATRMIDHANHGSLLDTPAVGRPVADGSAGDVKVGGHQASSASMVSIMTALWFVHIDHEDKVAVKPHASPVYHAIKYLTGELDRSYLTTLRRRGGLQAYPSRTKDPDVADFSTGSVGLGAVAPLFSALVRRYTDAHFGVQPTARFIATIGDAELDEGNVWEAIADPACQGLGNVTLVVDLNRQSLDRVVPEIQSTRLQRFFADAGWHVAEAKYGARLSARFARRGGAELRSRIDAMSNEAYQSLFALDDAAARAKFLDGADPLVAESLADLDDAAFKEVVTDLGGHDLGLLIDTFRACDAERDRPSVVFAYTVKGWGLPIAGNPLNHSALLTPAQIDEFRLRVGLTAATEWDRFDPASPAGEWCDKVGGRINNPPRRPRPQLSIPQVATAMVSRGMVSSQEAFGRVLARLAEAPELAPRLVTTSPDVSISTNLGGWINKVGVFSPVQRDDHGARERLLRWVQGPTGQHIELGISEMNLFLLLGQLGLSHDHHGEQLLPIGTVYDPFVLRGLDALIYGVYNGSRFIVVGTPSGVTLAPEGGAHQSTITPSVGAELPGLVACEPAYATEVDWLLCAALEELTSSSGESTYLRLSTRPIDQAPFGAALERYGEVALREHVLAGGYRLAEARAGSSSDSSGEDRPGVTLVTTGVMATEALTAAELLHDEGVAATVIHLTSPDRAFRSWQHRFASATATATTARPPSLLHQLVQKSERSRPVVSVHDAASHSLAWVGSVLGTRQYCLGVDRFGESGTVADLYDAVGISAGHIVNAALIAVADHDG